MFSSDGPSVRFLTRYDDVNRRALSTDDNMHTCGTCFLRKSADGVFYRIGSSHHKVCKFVDNDYRVGQNFHSNARIWSIRKRGKVQRIHMRRNTTKKVLPINHTAPGMKSITLLKPSRPAMWRGAQPPTREKPHTGAAAREQPRDSPVIERGGPSRDGDPYDGYGEAEAYAMKVKEQAEKAEKAKAEKERKIARDKAQREAKAKAKAEREGK